MSKPDKNAGANTVFLKRHKAFRVEGEHVEGILKTNNKVLVKHLISRGIGSNDPWPGQNTDGSYTSPGQPTASKQASPKKARAKKSKTNSEVTDA